MSVHKESEDMPVVADAESVVTEVKQEEEHVQLSLPQPSMRCTIMCTLYKVTGVLLCLWLSAVLWLPPAKTALEWATQYLQYIAAFALMATALTHIPYSLPILAIHAWVVRCTSPISCLLQLPFYYSLTITFEYWLVKSHQHCMGCYSYGVCLYCCCCCSCWMVALY